MLKWMHAPYPLGKCGFVFWVFSPPPSSSDGFVDRRVGTSLGRVLSVQIQHPCGGKSNPKEHVIKKSNQTSSPQKATAKKKRARRFSFPVIAGLELFRGSHLPSPTPRASNPNPVPTQTAHERIFDGSLILTPPANFEPQ